MKRNISAEGETDRASESVGERPSNERTPLGLRYSGRSIRFRRKRELVAAAVVLMAFYWCASRDRQSGAPARFGV